MAELVFKITMFPPLLKLSCVIFLRTFLITVVVLTISTSVYPQRDTFKSADGNFSISLSVKPTSEANSDIPDSKPGGKIFTWIMEKEMMAFAVTYADSIWAKHGEEKMRVGKAADGLIEAFEARGDKLISRRDINLADIPGVEVKYRKKDYILINRYYMLGIRLYSVMGMCVAGPNETQILKTIDSFQITPSLAK